MRNLVLLLVAAFLWAWGWYTRGGYERRHRPVILKDQIERDNRAAYHRGRSDREREIRAAVSNATATGHEHLTPPIATFSGITERDTGALPGGTLGPAQINATTPMPEPPMTYEQSHQLFVDNAPTPGPKSDSSPEGS